jgi:hypothetical protein
MEVNFRIGFERGNPLFPTLAIHGRLARKCRQESRTLAWATWLHRVVAAEPNAAAVSQFMGASQESVGKESRILVLAWATWLRRVGSTEPRAAAVSQFMDASQESAGKESRTLILAWATWLRRVVSAALRSATVSQFMDASRRIAQMTPGSSSWRGLRGYAGRVPLSRAPLRSRSSWAPRKKVLGRSHGSSSWRGLPGYAGWSRLRCARLRSRSSWTPPEESFK